MTLFSIKDTHPKFDITNRIHYIPDDTANFINIHRYGRVDKLFDYENFLIMFYECRILYERFLRISKEVIFSIDNILHNDENNEICLDKKNIYTCKVAYFDFN